MVRPQAAVPLAASPPVWHPFRAAGRRWSFGCCGSRYATPGGLAAERAVHASLVERGAPILSTDLLRRAVLAVPGILLRRHHCDGAEQAIRDTEADWIAFSSLERIKSHWDRPGWWPGRRAYYWYLTFAEEPELHAIAAQCQAELEAPYLDRVPLTDLHMTIERVAFDEEINETELDQIASVAEEACRALSPFTLYVGPLAGSSGAISFSASPYETIARLRNTLVTATKTVLGEVSSPDGAHFRPHVGIAYCNDDVAAGPIINTVRSIRRMPIIEVDVGAVALVALKREQNSYRWIEKYTIPLGMA